jgi:hypothetical protein
MKIRTIAFTALALAASLVSCKKETIYTYGVDDVRVEQPGVVKPNLKNDLEFISIAYTDLHGSTIPQDKLEEMALCYTAFGDKRLMIDMVILNMLNEPGVLIPAEATMLADPNQFVVDTYHKFYVRQPSQFEEWWLADKIRTDTALSPELVYYTFMTSDEYRYY